MTGADSQTRESQSRGGARARVRELERAASELRGHIEREREGGPPSADEVRAAVTRAREAVDDIQQRIDATKAEAKALKEEIEGLQRRHAEVPEAERMIEWPRLVGEQMRKLAEVGVREGLIASLEGQKLDATGALEAARQRRAAFEAGVFSRPVEEDPRLVSLREELSAAAAVLGADRPQRAGSKKKAQKRAPRKTGKGRPKD